MDIRPPWEHQKEAVRRAAPVPDFAFLFEQGCGKSRALIDTLRVKFTGQNRILRTLIFGPPIVIKNWFNEWQMFSKIPKSEVICLTGSGADRLETFMKHAFRDGKAQNKIFITNYETLLMLDVFKAFLQWNPEDVVLDEAHRLKDHKAKKSKLLDEMTNFQPHPRPMVQLLTGTLILTSPLDAFQPFKIMDGGQTLGKNYYAFRGRFFRDRNAGMKNDQNKFSDWQPMTKEKDGWDAAGEIQKLIFSKAMRVEKKDCLDLPQEIDQILHVEMTPEQTRIYKEMKNELVAFLGDRYCTASLAITKALRLMQITSGFLPVQGRTDEEAPAVITLHKTPKQLALKTLLEDLTPNHKVLVWAVWKENYAQIKEVCEELKIAFVECNGSITPVQKQRNIERFNTDPDARVFIGHPGSGGIGVNLVVAPYSVFYSRTFSLEHWLQARARNHRGGSEIHEKITHYHLVVQNTIDEKVVEALKNKIEMSDKILKQIKDQI